MNKYLRLLAALLALLMATTFCAMAQEIGVDWMEAREPVPQSGADDAFDNEVELETSDQPESGTSGGTVVEGVEPPATEEEQTLGDDEPEDLAGGDSDVFPRPENTPVAGAQESEEPEVISEDSDDADTVEGPEAANEPEAIETPELIETPEAAAEPQVSDEPEAMETPQATTTPEVTPVPEPAESPEDADVVMEASEDVSGKQALEATQVAVMLGVGEKFQIPELEGTDAPAYGSANPKVASVSATGLIKGKKRGSTTVAATRGETTMEYLVQVVKAPKKIKFSKKTLTLGFDAAQNLGQQFQLVPKLTAGSSSRITYYGYNARVVSVSEDGVVTPVGIGTTRIKARTYNKKTASIKIKVLSAPGSVALNVAALNISVGGTYKLKCTIPKKTTSPISYSSDNSDCVAVSDKGVLTAISEGTAGITAKSFNGVEAFCAVTVLPAPEPIELAFASASLGVGQKSVPLLGAADVGSAYGGVTFTSSNKKVATVSKLGVIKAKKRGTATIRIKGGSGSKASVKVKVYKAPTKVTLSAKSLTMDQFSGVQLGASLPKGQAGSVTFTSSNASVAEVDANGFVTAVGKGSAKITAKTYNGKKASCTVKVVATKVEIRMADTAVINTSDFVDFPIEILVASGESYRGKVDISIAPSDVAVYEDGKLLGKLAGRTAILTVKAGGVSRTCNITVEGEAGEYSVKAIAHRGGAKWPENTIEAFENFASTGADGVELDIQTTSDGVQVVNHDETYEANGVIYTIFDQEFETVRALKPSIPTLDEALDVIAKTGKDIYMNPKDHALADKCVKAIRDRGLQSRTMYFCNNEELLKQIYEADSSAVIGFSRSKDQTAMGDDLLKTMKQLHAQYFVPHYKIVTQEVVNYWHEKGYKICVWTVDSKTTIRSLCAMGVDSILSNYPEYVVDIRSGG